MTGRDQPMEPVPNEPEGVEEEEEEEEEEYNVEDIRAERKNLRTGVLEYLIKWENYPETQNTWEPIDNLKCPDIIQRFKEREKNRRRRRSSTGLKEGVQSGPKRLRPTDEPIIVEEVEIGSTTETLSSTDTAGPSPATEEPAADTRVPPRGFERGLPIDDIIASCTDEQEKLFFFVKWKGLGELEMISSEELEEHAPRELCIWYRKRLLYSIEISKSNDKEVAHQQKSGPSAVPMITAS